MSLFLNPSRPSFAQTDTFQISAPNVGEIESLRITSDGRGLGSAWHLDSIEVHNSATNELLTFPLKGWIDREHGLSHLLYPDRDGDGIGDISNGDPVKVRGTRRCAPSQRSICSEPVDSPTSLLLLTGVSLVATILEMAVMVKATEMISWCSCLSAGLPRLRLH